MVNTRCKCISRWCRQISSWVQKNICVVICMLIVLWLFMGIVLYRYDNGYNANWISDWINSTVVLAAIVVGIIGAKITWLQVEVSKKAHHNKIGQLYLDNFNRLMNVFTIYREIIIPKPEDNSNLNELLKYLENNSNLNKFLKYLEEKFEHLALEISHVKSEAMMMLNDDIIELVTDIYNQIMYMNDKRKNYMQFNNILKVIKSQLNQQDLERYQNKVNNEYQQMLDSQMDFKSKFTDKTLYVEKNIERIMGIYKPYTKII